MTEPMDAGHVEEPVSSRGSDEPMAPADVTDESVASADVAGEAVVSADGAAQPATASDDGVELSAADASLLALIDRLTGVLERSDLGELEVAAGDTTIVLRAPLALTHGSSGPAPTAPADPVPDPPDADRSPGRADAPPSAATEAPSRPSVKAPLTGIYYGAPSPGATPYVSVGDHVSVGQIIGLIEAMKLFNEIKSDLAGRVARVCAENGALVKAKQPLIEVEPA